MAIYHCSVRTFSRSDNHSAVAASAYRSGSVLKDERTGQSHNYRNRKGIVHALVLLPPNAPQAYADRLTLWNAAESAERKKNSRVAREVILALPHELSESQRTALTRDMALFLVEKYGVAVDMAVHAPLAHHGDDPRNHHAHLLFTTRVVKQDGLGEKTRILDDKEQGPIQIELIRQVWETLANDALQQAGFTDLRIDRRTLEAQGIDRIPQEHVGKAGTHADDEETPRKKSDDEEGEDGETDTGKGKAGSGDKALTPSADKKDSSPSKQKPAAKEKRLDRLTLNEEIKRLNAERAAFSPVPLKDQIKELDRLMDRLDGRVQRLKLLSQKTSLPERITRAIVSLYHRAKNFLVVRAQGEAARSLHIAERDTKAERQRARYGTTYRAHVSERMTEMRENIEILQTKQKQYQKYKTFVDLIERRIETVKADIKPPALPIKSEWKITTAQAIQSKIILEAKQVREKIPIEYRPTLKQESLSKTFITTLKASASRFAINNTIAPTVKTSKTEDSKRSEKSFTAATTPPKDNKDRNIWYKETTIKFKSLEQTRAEQAPIPIKEPMDSPKVWLVQANQKGRAILDRMQADIRERKAATPTPNPSGFSGRFNHPAKIITNEEAIKKVRMEAKIARAKVPPDLQAAPYGKKCTPMKVGVSGTWGKATKPEQAQSKQSMASKFNQAAQPNPQTNISAPPPPDNKVH